MAEDTPLPANHLPAGHKAVRARISGRVQGVWFRKWTVQNATELQLDGWVRNREDGTVEALFVGPDATVDEMLRRCWSGPDRAEVTNVEVEPSPGITAKGFTQKPTV
ncbi:MAG TPA: acylphosphatase [Pedomonas sp.]|nr:acylphosphatase [Pedomonas sp.]